VTVAIIDSSVDTDHEDLVNALLPGCDLFDRDDDPNPGPFDPNGFDTKPTHGTHVAGMVAATGNNGIGVAGIAFSGVQILPVKVFNDGGVGAQIDDLINGIRWSVGLAVPGFNPNPHPAQILNLSLGTRGQNAAVDEAVAEAIGAGALVVAAAGNQELSSGVLTPANAEGALSIGSVDSNYIRSETSNYNQNEPQVDLVAPGGKLVDASDDFCASGSDDNILSTFAGDNYGCLAGTSMSAPFVAGVAALIWSQNPDFTAEQVTERMLASTLSTPDQDPFEYGAGVLCADRALGAATLCGR
jgi:serine protease